LDDFNYGRAVRKSNIFCNEIFDKICGKRLFSLRCFGVSCCVSIIFVSILSIATFSIGEIYYEVAGDNVAALVFILSTAAMLNTWIDYISLVETRLILRFASRVKPLILPVLLLVDLFLTVIVFWLCVGELERAVVGTVKYSPSNAMSFMLVFATLRVRAEPILFYSTFSTSVIFYIYCLSTLLFKFAKLTKPASWLCLRSWKIRTVYSKPLGDSWQPFYCSRSVCWKSSNISCRHEV
jgi:hypothetical protein